MERTIDISIRDAAMLCTSSYAVFNFTEDSNKYL